MSREAVATWLPEGQVESCRIEHFKVSEEQAQRSAIRALCSREYSVPAGAYTRLMINNQVVMSDTPMERRTNSSFIYHAKGHVLVFGLGLGMVLADIAPKDSVESILVVELDPRVIQLVEPNLRAHLGQHADKLTIVQGDAYDWKPPKGTRYNTIWFDIWTDQSRDDLPDMKRLKLRSVRWRAQGAWVDCWKVYGLERR